MKDPIEREDAINAVHESIFVFFDTCNDDEETPMTHKDEKLLEINKAITTRIKALPSAQPDLNEWCMDCKEYDKEKHHCPRFNRVIREALKDTQPEIIYCKDCVKHNIGVDDTPYKSYVCPLVKFRGKAQGHEFDYQYCAYGARKE